MQAKQLERLCLIAALLLLFLIVLISFEAKAMSLEKLDDAVDRYMDTKGICFITADEDIVVTIHNVDLKTCARAFSDREYRFLPFTKKALERNSFETGDCSWLSENGEKKSVHHTTEYECSRIVPTGRYQFTVNETTPR